MNQPSNNVPTVLLADDDKRLLTALAMRLRSAGYNVIECQDAYMATDLAMRHLPDAIVLDLNMPAGNGDSTHERLRRNKATARIPIIYLTGDQSARVDECAERLGAFAVLRKPCAAPELLDYLQAATRREAA